MSNAKQPYIFISYAHRDKELIYPFISALKEKYEVWFDEGIHYGREWEEEIAAKLNGCSIFIYAITENSLNSENCKDELYHARNKSKNFLNVLFSEDVVLPEWFEFRYGRYQMCYYNRFPSAQAVVEDLGQKCEWFEDVKIQTVQGQSQEKEDLTQKLPIVEQSTSDKMQGSSSTQVNEKSLDLNRILEEYSSIGEKVESQSSYDESEQADEADFDLNIIPEEYSDFKSYKKIEDDYSFSDKDKKDTRRFTREQIVEAVEYANKNERERSGENTVRQFILHNKLKDSRIDNAIKKYAKTATRDRVIAMRDMTMLNSGKEGVLITDIAVYNDYPKDAKPVDLSKLNSVEKADATHILVRYSDSSTKKVYYGSINLLLVYDFFTNLLDQDSGK